MVATESNPRTRRRLLLPIPKDRLVRRLIQLYVGLALYGAAIGFLVRAELGLDPWDVLHQGLNRVTGLSFGTITIIVGVVVLLLWIPLRQRPGLGTLSNVVVVGLCADLALWLIPEVHKLAFRIPFLIGGVLLTALAAAIYIGAGFGPGPRDGLMTGLHARGFGSIRVMRTLVEIVVLAIGWLLGGSVGVGTVLFAVSIGPLIHWMMPYFDLSATKPRLPKR